MQSLMYPSNLLRSPPLRRTAERDVRFKERGLNRLGNFRRITGRGRSTSNRAATQGMSGGIFPL